MDNLLVQTIDNLLMEKLPTKSSLSSAEWTIAYPQATSSLDCNGSNVYRFQLPKYPNGYLCATKGGLSSYFQFNLTGTDGAVAPADQTTQMVAEAYGVFRQIKVFLNGVQITDLQYNHHVYAEWLKKRDTNWLTTDGANFGLPEAGAWTAISAFNITPGKNFTLPMMDNFSLFSKNFALPLSSVDIVIEVTLNDFGKFATGLTAANAVSALGRVTMNNLSLMLPICHVDPEVDRAIQSKLEAGDVNESDMFLLPIENVRCDAQSYNFNAGSNTKSFIWNTVSSSVRFLELVVSTDVNNSATNLYKTATKVNPGVLNYIYRIDGKNVTQTNVTTDKSGFDQAYQFRNDLSSAYNYINNEQAYNMGSIRKSVFNNESVAPPVAVNSSLVSSFEAVAILDTVSKDNVVSGAKVINNLQTELQYNAANAIPNANVYLIQHSNAVVAFSKSKAKLLL